LIPGIGGGVLPNGGEGAAGFGGPNTVFGRREASAELVLNRKDGKSAIEAEDIGRSANPHLEYFAQIDL
jgi:hypothetical protein